MIKTKIEVGEKNEPLLKIPVYQVDPVTGVKTPYDLTAVTNAEFIIKNSHNDSDELAIATFTLASGVSKVTPAGGTFPSELHVQVEDTATPAAGTKWYHFDIVENSHRRTLLYGSWVIINL